MNLSLIEILIIVGAVVLLFGAKRIPEFARALGRASNEYKKAKDAITNEVEELSSEEEKESDKK